MNDLCHNDNTTSCPRPRSRSPTPHVLDQRLAVVDANSQVLVLLQDVGRLVLKLQVLLHLQIDRK